MEVVCSFSARQGFLPDAHWRFVYLHLAFIDQGGAA